MLAHRFDCEPKHERALLEWYRLEVMAKICSIAGVQSGKLYRNRPQLSAKTLELDLHVARPATQRFLGLYENPYFLRSVKVLATVLRSQHNRRLSDTSDISKAFSRAETGSGQYLVVSLVWDHESRVSTGVPLDSNRIRVPPAFPR
jgi:hypothetical protein